MSSFVGCLQIVNVLFSSCLCLCFFISLSLCFVTIMFLYFLIQSSIIFYCFRTTNVFLLSLQCSIALCALICDSDFFFGSFFLKNDLTLVDPNWLGLTMCGCLSFQCCRKRTCTSIFKIYNSFGSVDANALESHIDDKIELKL
jgi:hypothetical protein